MVMVVKERKVAKLVQLTRRVSSSHESRDCNDSIEPVEFGAGFLLRVVSPTAKCVRDSEKKATHS